MPPITPPAIAPACLEEPEELPEVFAGTDVFVETVDDGWEVLAGVPEAEDEMNDEVWYVEEVGAAGGAVAWAPTPVKATDVNALEVGVAKSFARLE